MVSLPTVQEVAQDPNIRTVVPKIPDYLQVRFRQVLRLQEELETLRANLRGFPRVMRWDKGGIAQQKRSHQTRIRDLEIQIQALRKIAAAVREGYEPYTTPKGWWAGFVGGKPFDWWRDTGNSWTKGKEALSAVFNAPMPAEVLEKYKEAQRSGLFDHFIVVSPNPDLFLTIPAPLFCEPFLLGFIGTDSKNPEFRLHNLNDHGDVIANSPHFRVTNAVGLEIAHWDLEKDRQAAGLSF